MTAPLTFYFDFISPYAWLGWSHIHALAERHQRPLELRPVLFAALLNRYGHLGPAEIPPKREYVMKNCLRVGAEHGVVVRPPPSHPFNPLLALRVACIEQPPERRRRVIQALYEAVWAGGPGVTDPAVVVGLLDAALGGARAGLDGAALVAAASTPEVKGRLKENTAAALAAGVFGVPTVIADGELFWGFDAHPHLERFLEGRDAVDPALVEAWRDLPSTAQRR